LIVGFRMYLPPRRAFDFNRLYERKESRMTFFEKRQAPVKGALITL